MKKIILGVLVAMFLVACAKEESRILSQGDEITRSIKPSNAPLMNYLKGSIWEEAKAFVYSEPDGKGEEKVIFDAETMNSSNWKPYEFLTFSDEQFLKYIPVTREVQTYHYYDFDILEFKDDTFIFTRNNEEYYLKVLAYGDGKIWIETNCYNVDKNYQKRYGRADSYPYVRILYLELPLKSYPIDGGFKSEEEITPYEIEYPVVLPENLFEQMEEAPLWKCNNNYPLVYDRDKLFFNDNLIVYKGGYAYDKGYNNNEFWFKVIDGVLYKIRYYYNGVGNAAHYTLVITKYETPENHVLGYSENGNIIVSEKDYNSLIKQPYSTNNPYPFIPTQCFYISNDATEDDMAMLKDAYENPNVIKEYKNFSE
ncbi:MAG: hypothetical protein IJB87_07770 [Alistipes sp.]|nr:hypothetical protein [Alistipes sp.]